MLQCEVFFRVETKEYSYFCAARRTHLDLYGVQYAGNLSEK